MNFFISFSPGVAILQSHTVGISIHETVSITLVFPSPFNKGMTAGGELRQEVLIAVWGAECQRATDNDTETEHRRQCASSDWTRSANSNRERDEANTGALGILIEDREKEEGRKTS